MSLTSSQLNALRLDLQSLANIEYDDVLNELLDHYAVLTEQKLREGLAFDDASKWAWAELGSGMGLQAVQDDYVTNIQQQVSHRHLSIMQNYFRWPTLLTTALIGVLVYLMVPLVPANVVTAVFWFLAFTPTAITIWGYRRSVDQSSSSGRITFQYMGQRMGGLPLNVGTVFFIFDTPKTYLQTHATVLILICSAILLYIISFVQLFREEFTHKPQTA